MRKQLLLALASALLTIGGAAAAPQQPAPPTLAEPMAIKTVFGKRLVATPAFAIPMKAPAAKAADWTGRTFGGALIYSDAWSDMFITEVPYGLYDFTIGADDISGEVRYTAMSNNWMSGAVRRNRFYGIRNVNMFGALSGVVTTEIDLASMTSLREVFADEPSFGKLPSAMAYDPTSGEIYGIFYNDEMSGLNWVRFDTKTLEAEIICRFGGKFNVVALGAAPDGTMYAVSTDGDLYTVNKKNARVSLVGSTGVNVAAYTQAIAWDAKTNTFLWSAVTPSGSALYSLDPAGPTATLIKEFTQAEQFASVYFYEQTAMEGAPASPASLKWNYTTPGAFDGNVTFTTPSAGEVTVYLNGEIVKDAEKTSAGTAVTIPFSGLENKTNHVAAVVKNEKGWSPVAESFSYTGFDVPLPVTDLKFEENEGVANVSWTAPAGGVEDGFIDPDKLYYKVYRMPDSILVADNHRTTTFSETLPTGVKRYAYRVIPFNGSDKEGAPTLSNALVYGKAYGIPYADDFTMEGCLDVYELIDGDGDGQNWYINSFGDKPLLASSVTYDQNVAVTDNWIISPKISLEKGNLYRVTIHMRNTWSGNPDKLAVGFCPGDNTDKDGVKIVETLEVNTPQMTLVDHCVDFSVEDGGDYKVALGFVTPKGEGGGVFISELRVDKLGSLSAPAAVSGLKVIPDENGDARATITFTAPGKNLAGETLGGSMTANIYRDGTPAGKVEGIAPGSDVSWTDDSNPAAGNHTYTVRLANEYGEGGDASASAFVGTYGIPYVNALDSNETCEFFTYCPVGFEETGSQSEMAFYPYGDPSLCIQHMNYTDEHHEMYAVLPLINYDDETVFKVSFEIKKMAWGDFSVSMACGDRPEADAMTTECFDIAAPTGYDYESREGLVVLPKGGKKYLAFHITAPTQGYLYLYLRNLRIEREASAFAPDVVAELNAASDLTSKLTFKAPAVDYAGRPLKGLDKVEIYRNGSVTPTRTFENPAPGEALEWTDKDALPGFNSYFIVASNSFGRGKPVTVRPFIGFDQPTAPAGIAIVPNPGNQTATVTWEAAVRGVNGGVLDQDNLSYTLVRVIPSSDGSAPEVKVLKTGITETSVVPEREATDNQEMIYYGVAAVTPQGVSDPSIYLTILGKPYSLPFAESFANGEPKSGLWVNTGNQSYGLQALPTSGDVLEFNGYPNVCQDDDNGVFLFLNGAYQENPITFAVLTPKVDLSTASDPQVSFWLYKGNQSGNCQTVPSFEIYASTTEADFRLLGGTEWTETSPAWVEYTYPLDMFAGDPGALIFQLNATAGMKSDIIIMDNFRVESTTSIATAGVDKADCGVFGVAGGILTRGAVGSEVRVYTPAGLLLGSYEADDNVHPFTPGIYIVSLANRSFKVVVK